MLLVRLTQWQITRYDPNGPAEAWSSRDHPGTKLMTLSKRRKDYRTDPFLGLAIVEACGDSDLGREFSGPAAETRVCPARSLAAPELLVRCFRKSSRIAPVFSFRLVEQRAQAWARPRFVNYPLPSGVAVELRKEGRQCRRQFLPLFRRERLDGLFNFLNRAHMQNLGRRKGAFKS